MIGENLDRVMTASRREKKTHLEVVYDVLKEARATVQPNFGAKNLFLNIHAYTPQDISLIGDILFANFCTYKIIVMNNEPYALITQK